MYELKTLEDTVNRLDKLKPVFCDTETVGFYGKIRLLQIMQEGWKKVILVEWPNPFQVALLIKQFKTVWHNAHYDLSTIQDNSAPLGTVEFEDTFLLSRLAQPMFETYSLDDVIERTIGYCPYEEQGLNKTVLQKSNWGAVRLTKEQLLYAATDVLYMPNVWETVKDFINDRNYILDKSNVLISLDFQLNGIPVDQERLAEEYTKITKELKEIPMPINANSWQQVRKWLGVEQSDKKFLSTLAINGDDRAKNIMRVRTLRKLLTFLEKYDKERVIGKFKPSARSGRYTSSDENLQQIPRALKGVFGVSKDSGRVIIFSDYPQLELRTICAILGVSVMEQMFREGVDLHGYVASVLFGPDYTAADRNVTKTYNFNLLYGGSVSMVLSILITYGMWIEERLANRHKRKWLNLFTEINSWQQEQISAWRKGRLGSTPFGRQYKGKLMTDQMNIMNQGAGAEVAKLALHYLHPWLKEQYGAEVVLVNFIHDSFIIEAPNDPEVYELVANKLAECMQDSWFEMSKLYKIKDLPMPIEVSVGYNWGDIEAGKDLLYNHSIDPYKMLESVDATV